MKILITTDAYNSMINGVAISVKNLSAALQDAGHEVRILTLSQTHQSGKDNDVYYIGSVPIKIYPDTRATFFFHHPLLKDIVSWHPDIIHSQCEFFTFIFAKKLAKRLQIPIIHTYHTLYEYYTHYFCPSKTLGRKIVAVGSRFVCNHTDIVIAPTKKTASILESYCVDRPLKIIPTGLSLERLQIPADKNLQSKLKQKFQIPENVPVLVTLGRLAREKNIDFLIRQMSHLSLRKKKFHLLIVGDGPDRERLESLVHHLDLKDIVHFTGMVNPQEVAQYYRLGDAFVSASNSETQGLTYIEALACGLPLLCKKDICLDGVLQPGKNGFMFEDETEFAVNCMKLFESQTVLREMVQYAFQTSLQFSRETFALRVLALYQEIILEKKEQKQCTQFVCIPKQI